MGICISENAIFVVICFNLSMNFVLFWLFIVRYSGIRFELEYKQKSRWTLNSFWVPSIYLGVTVLTIQNFTIIESLHCDLTNYNKEILVKKIYNVSVLNFDPLSSHLDRAPVLVQGSQFWTFSILTILLCLYSAVFRRFFKHFHIYFYVKLWIPRRGLVVVRGL